MGKISEIFNFDNIGGKIKNLAKWSCWITILLIWIAAPIAFIALVADDYTAELCWIPLVGAIVGPIFVWIGSWAMYAFGEFVERTCDNEDNTRLILEKLTEDDYDNNYTTAEEVDEDNIAEDYIEDDEPQEYVPSCTEEERKRKIVRITDLRKKGLISEELYQKAINNPSVLDKF
jgi:hypothetical protein